MKSCLFWQVVSFESSEQKFCLREVEMTMQIDTDLQEKRFQVKDVLQHVYAVYHLAM